MDIRVCIDINVYTRPSESADHRSPWPIFRVHKTRFEKIAFMRVEKWQSQSSFSSSLRAVYNLINCRSTQTHTQEATQRIDRTVIYGFVTFILIN